MLNQSPAELRHINLDQLYLHDMNPRQNGSPEDTEAMAQSIAINGLLQNLLGFADPDRPGEIGIVAGGRRLRGLQHLKREGSGLMDSKEPDWGSIPVQVTDDPYTARAWAGTESATQKPLHPADEIRAYAAMMTQGNDATTIAKAFAQTERHVKGRLALAHLRDETIEALRGGHISLDAAKALTLARDPEQELSVLTAARAGNWHSNAIRRELTETAIRGNDRRARYVGKEHYLAEGGTIREDLFDDDSYFEDGALLEKLFAEKLEADAALLRENGGWKWAKTSPNSWVGYETTEKFKRFHKIPGELSEADAAEYDSLAEAFEADAIDDNDRKRLEELQDRLDGDWLDEVRETAGIFVYVDNRGELQFDGAYRERTAKGSSKAEDTGGAPSKPKPDLTQAGTEDLRRIALLALQSALVDKTELVLDLFAWQLDRRQPAYASPFAINATDQNIAPEAEGSWHVDNRLEEGSNAPDHQRKIGDAIAEFAAFQDQGKKHRNAVLTRHLVRTLQGAPVNTLAAQILADRLEVDIRKVWTPDGPTYFSRLGVSAMEAIWAELLDLDADDDRRAEFAALKKAEKVKELDALFTDASVQEAHGLSRDQVQRIDTWLPPELRGDD